MKLYNKLYKNYTKNDFRKLNIQKKNLTLRSMKKTNQKRILYKYLY